MAEVNKKIEKRLHVDLTWRERLLRAQNDLHLDNYEVLAEKMGVSVSIIQKIGNGSREASEDIQARILTLEEEAMDVMKIRTALHRAETLRETTAPYGESRLAALRRSVDKLRDLAESAEQYQRMVRRELDDCTRHLAELEETAQDREQRTKARGQTMEIKSHENHS